jgi:hypothetical protein
MNAEQEVVIATEEVSCDEVAQAVSDNVIENADETFYVQITANERKHYVEGKHTHKVFGSPEEEFEFNKSRFKSCNKCNKNLCFNCFGGNTSGKDPFDKNGYRLKRGDCISCNKNMVKGKQIAKGIAKKMGVDTAPEGTECELCHKTDNIVFDHHHELNVFRGWICNGCNRSIGMLGEDINKIKDVINYLNKLDKKTLFVDENGDLQIK